MGKPEGTVIQGTKPVTFRNRYSNYFSSNRWSCTKAACPERLELPNPLVPDKNI